MQQMTDQPPRDIDRDVPKTTRFDVSNAIASMRSPAELWALASLLICYFFAYASNTPQISRAINIVGPLALTVILTLSCRRIIQSSSIAIWAPLFWFRLACAAYFGFGALAPQIADENTLMYIYGLYYFDDFLNLKVNLIYVTGIFFMLISCYVILATFNYRQVPNNGQIEIKNTNDRTFIFAVSFLAVGGVIRYLIILPHTFSVTDTVLPGIIVSLAKIYYAGIYLFIRYIVESKRSYFPFAAILVFFEIIVSVASFAKTDLILIMIFTLLALTHQLASKSTIAIGVGAIVAAYLAFQPLVIYGRDELSQRYGEIRGAGLEERWSIAASWLADASESKSSASQGWLTRLSYVNVNAFVVDQYDSGHPGDTYRDAAAVLIPRVLWTNKPVISQLGQDLNILVFQTASSQLGLGYFAEAYWNFGWLGVIGLMPVLALILCLFTRVSLTIMYRHDWALLPIVFLGVNLGLRVDGYFVVDTLGQAWMALVIGLALYVPRHLARQK